MCWLVGLCTPCTKIVFEARFPCFASSRHIVLSGRGTNVGDTPQAHCSEPPSLLSSCLGEGVALAAATRDLTQDLPPWGGHPGQGERKRRLLEGTNEAEIKKWQGKERRKGIQSRNSDTLWSWGKESVYYSAFTLLLLSSAH